MINSLVQRASKIIRGRATGISLFQTDPIKASILYLNAQKVHFSTKISSKLAFLILKSDYCKVFLHYFVTKAESCAGKVKINDII